jgi:hypothetical protein
MNPSPCARRRRARAVPALLVACGLLVVALVLDGCGSTAAARAPSGGAARVVPADALAYVDLSLNRSDSAVSQTEQAVDGLPGYRAFVRSLTSRLSAITGTPFATQIKPWLGSEVAVALVPEGASADELIVLQASDRARARAFLTTLSGGAEARLIDGYVVVGEPAAVADVGTGHTLASSRGFRAAQAAAPADRVLDAYATGTGLAELLDGRTGLAGVGAAVLGAEAPSSVEAALSPAAGGLRVWVRMTGIEVPSTPFTPALAAHLPAGTTWVAQMSSLTGSTPGLLSVLASAGGFGSGASSVSALVDKLGPALQAEGVATAPLASLFNHQSAIFDLDDSLGVMTRTRDTKAARLELGNAGQALAELFAATRGDSATAAPLVNTGIDHGVAVTEYQEQAGSQLDLAVFDGVIVITTSQRAMDAIVDHQSRLSASRLYRSVIPIASVSAGPVLFGAISDLVRRGGAAGLLQSLGLNGATRVLDRIAAAGLASTGSGTQTTAELYFTIS